MTTTVPLVARDLPRRFRSGNGPTYDLTETSLLSSQPNYALLGDPGAGKTTTIKRLAHRLLFEPSSEDADSFAYPVVVVLRDYNLTDVSLFDILGALLGINAADAPAALAKSWTTERLITEFLDAGPAVVFVDGLDEVPMARRRGLEREIVRLADHLASAKVIVSCRSGEYQQLDGFTLAELAPLTEDQIFTIATGWLGEASGFFEQLRDNPARDLVDRPLFLAQLLVIYDNGGEEITDQPSALYRQIVRLMLQDWDQERAITRRSSYGHFHVEEKLEFLSAMAFHLTVGLRALSFTTQQLESLYRNIAPRFRLPRGEAAAVAEEIESHTGLIVKSGQSFEFSHLSLQEYLCAYYIVRQPLTEEVADRVAEHPAPMAVAVALSSDPASWLSQCVLTSRGLEDEASVRSFVTRLSQERPRFARNELLGYAILKLMWKYGNDDIRPFERMLLNSQLKESLYRAYQHYSVTYREDVSILTIRGIQARGPAAQAPRLCMLRPALLELVRKTSS